MAIRFSEHAKSKMEVLKRHGVKIDKKFIEQTVIEPEKLEPGYKDRMIAQKKLDEFHVLRVVYEKGTNNDILIITFYPGRSKRYDKS